MALFCGLRGTGKTGRVTLQTVCKILGTGLNLAQIMALTLGVAGVCYIVSLLS
jgi:hypothetical protein